MTDGLCIEMFLHATLIDVNLLPPPPLEGVLFFTAVCLSVCLCLLAGQLKQSWVDSH